MIKIILAAMLLTGCSSFKMGAVLYCPHGQNCTATVEAPAQAASAAR